jgi:hypothetical protein
MRKQSNATGSVVSSLPCRRGLPAPAGFIHFFWGVRVGERIRPPGTWFQLVEPACARTGCFPGPQLRQASGAFSRQGKAGPHAFNSHLRRAMVFFSSSHFNLFFLLTLLREERRSASPFRIPIDLASASAASDEVSYPLRGSTNC